MGYDASFTVFTPVFQQADVVYGNLEGPVGIGGAPLEGKQLTFLQRPLVMPALKRAGFDVLHLANNHILDFGPPALDETLALARPRGLQLAGRERTLRRQEHPLALRPQRECPLPFCATQIPSRKRIMPTKTSLAQRLAMKPGCAKTWLLPSSGPMSLWWAFTGVVTDGGTQTIPAAIGYRRPCSGCQCCFGPSSPCTATYRVFTEWRRGL